MSTNAAPAVDLKVVKAENISFVNTLGPNTSFKLAFQYKHNLHYPAPNVARAELTVIAENSEDKEHFRISVTEVGVFSCPDQMPRETIHVETFQILFPYARALISSLTGLAGIPPILPPAIRINEENVMKIEFRPPQMPKENDEF